MRMPRAVVGAFHVVAGLGLVVSLMLTLAWLGSVRYVVSFTGTPYNVRYVVGRGCLYIDEIPRASGTGWGNPGWRIGDSGRFGFAWIPRLEALGGNLVTTIPLWIPLLVTVAVTLVARHLVRSQRHGLCRQCGYSREGLAIRAVCPECGRAP